MDNIGKRIAVAMELASFKSRKDFANFVEISYPTMNRWIEREKITSDGILKITNKVNISQNYLETGLGDAELTDSGISNYGHSARAKEVAEAYESMGNDDQKLLYSLAMRLKSDINVYSYLGNDIELMTKEK